MKRTFKQFSVANNNTPQPLVFTTLTALIAAGAGSNNFAVADSSFLLVGDKIVVGAGTAGAETVKITALPDGTHITAVTANAHANGVFVQLALEIHSLYVQRKAADAASLFIGTSGTMSDTVSRIAELMTTAAGVQPQEFTDALILPDKRSDLQEFWIYGTATQVYTPSVSL